jgi:hypothetical protein
LERMNSIWPSSLFVEKHSWLAAYGTSRIKCDLCPIPQFGLYFAVLPPHFASTTLR